MKVGLGDRTVLCLVAGFMLLSMFFSLSTRSVQAAATSTVTLTPTDNTFIDSSYPTVNYGTYNIFGALSYSSSGTVRTEQGWLKFGLSGIPSGVTITGATLTLSLWYTAVDQYVGVYPESSNSWSESTVTWNNAPLGSVGTASADSQFVTNSTTTYKWNVQAIVQSAVGSSYVSLVVQPTSPQRSDINGWSNFFTSRYNAADSPTLTITYLTAPPPIQATLSYSVVGGGTGFSPPTLTYEAGGVKQTTTLTTSPTVYKIDSGTSWNVSQTLGGSSSSERWKTGQTATGTATDSFTENFAYYNQYSLTISYTVVGGGSPSPPTLSYISFGSNLQAQLSASPQSFWLDGGSFASATNPLVGSTSDERWYSASANGTATSSSTVTVTYDHQYLLTAVGLTTGSEWENAGTQISVNVTEVAGRSNGVGYRLTSWTLDNGSPQIFPLTAGTVPVSFTMDSPHTVVFAIVKQYQVSLDSNATAALSSITPPTISGDQYWYDAGTPVSVVLDGVWGRSSGTGNRLVSYAANGGNVTQVSTSGTVTALSISAISSPQSVTASVATQYQLSTPTGSVATVTSPTITGDTGWYDSGTTATVSYNSIWNVVPQQSRVAATGYTIDGGSVTPVSESGSGTFAVSVTMNSAHTIDVKSVTQYFVSFKFTDASGSKTITPADLQISVGGQAQDVPGFSAFLDNGTTFTVSKVSYEGVDVKPTTPTQYSVSGPAVLTLKDSVYDVTLKVTDLLGFAVSGAQVHMILANGTTISGTTNGGGIFVVPSVPLGTFSASISGIGSSAQITGDASTQSVTPASVLFGTVSLAVIVVVVLVAAGASVFMLRRRSKGGLAQQPAQAPATLATCPNCGAPVGASEAFCEKCGTKLR